MGDDPRLLNALASASESRVEDHALVWSPEKSSKTLHVEARSKSSREADGAELHGHSAVVDDDLSTRRHCEGMFKPFRLRMPSKGRFAARFVIFQPQRTQ